MTSFPLSSSLKLERNYIGQVNHLKTLEATNSRLNRSLELYKADAANSALLKEQIKTLEHRITTLTPLRLQLAAAETELDHLRRSRDEWLTFLEGEESEDSTPHTISRALAAVRLENAVLQNRMGDQAAEIHTRDNFIRELEEFIDELEAKAKEKKEDANKLESKFQREERTSRLYQRELEMLKSQLVRWIT